MGFSRPESENTGSAAGRGLELKSYDFILPNLVVLLLVDNSLPHKSLKLRGEAPVRHGAGFVSWIRTLQAVSYRR